MPRMRLLAACLAVIALLLAACSNSTGSASQVASVRLTPAATAFAVSDSVLIAVDALDASGAPVWWTDNSTAATHTSWSSQPAGIVKMIGTHAVGIGTGVVTLTATIEGKSASVVLTVAGTSHHVAITASETWRAADGPHYVRALIHVGGTLPVTLTIEAGAQLRFDMRAALDFDHAGAVLSAVGTANAPIVMAADSEAIPSGTAVRAFWTGVLVASTASRLEHVVMSDCGWGIALVNPLSGCLVLVGLSGDSPRPVVKDLIIEDFDGSALVSLRRAGFGAGSANITITGGPGPAGLDGIPITISPNEVGTIPVSTTITGNVSNEVDVLTLTPSGVINMQYDIGDSTITESQTWPDLGVPYVIRSSIYIAGPNSPVLTLTPGMVFELQGSSVIVGRGAAGGLIAAGTVGAPILFTSIYAQKIGNGWRGIDFAAGTMVVSQLDHVIVEAGDTPLFTPPYAEVEVEVNGLGQLITNSEIQIAAVCGIGRHWLAAATNTDYTLPALGNSFSQLNTGSQCGP